MLRSSARRTPAAPAAHEPSGNSLGLSIADVAFVVLVAVTVVTYFRRLDGYEFRGDDWRVFQRGNTLGDFFEPYNRHLSVVPIAIYRLLLETFGLGSALPLRLVAVASLVAAAIAMYFVVRMRVGPALALVAGASLLWHYRLPLAPASFNHWLALAAVIFCSWALVRDSPKGDVAVGIALAFALCSSGVGVSGAAACLAFTALSRSPLRRWIAVGVPSAAWAAWWLFFSNAPASSRSLDDRVDYVLHGLSGSFRVLVGGSRVLGVMLGTLFVANLVWRLRGGLRSAGHEMSWCAALVVWWLGLASSRGDEDASVPRYLFVGSAFVILGFLPALRPEWAVRMQRSIAATVVAIGFVLTLVYTNNDWIVGDADRLLREGATVRQQLVAANLGPNVVPDDATLELGAAAPTPAGVYRALADEFGIPDGAKTSRPDAKIIALGEIAPVPETSDRDAQCIPLGGGLLLAPTSEILVRALERGVRVQLRRFGSEWVTVGHVPSRTTAVVELPGLHSATPWMLRAPGACRVRDTPTAVIVTPKPGAVVTGSVTLAATTQNVYATRVEFRLSGEGLDDALLGTGTPGFGWALRWDTTSVPDGTYRLTTVAFDSMGNADASDAITISVAN